VKPKKNRVPSFAATPSPSPLSLLLSIHFPLPSPVPPPSLSLSHGPFKVSMSSIQYYKRFKQAPHTDIKDISLDEENSEV
jgi:hypothetical protein